MSPLILMIIIICLFIVTPLTILIILVKNHLQHEKAKKIGILTNQGIRFFPSNRTKRITKGLVESWTLSLVNFWHEKEGWAKEDLVRHVQNTQVIFEDKFFFTISARKKINIKAKAYTLVDQKIIRISTTPLENSKTTHMLLAKDLFIHEVSHILTALSNPKYMTGEASHKLFEEVRLGV